MFLAQTLIHNFSGKGLVPDTIAGKPDFLLAVVIGAGLTVILATLTGFPISTTHSLTGALLGTGLMAVGAQVDIAVLGNRFFLPLLLSPFIAFFLTALLYMILRCARVRAGVTKEMCVCVGQTERVVAIAQPAATMSLRCMTAPDVTMDLEPNCSVRYSGQFLAINAQKLLDSLHYLSAGVVSFARGLNDTPKIVAMLIAVEALNIEISVVSVAVAMALGGLLSARKVAQKMSKDITKLNHGQGFTANLVTGILVIFASRFGLAVSTTHVSVGSLFGIGTVTRKANKGVISGILLSWVLTLPVAAALAAATFWVIH